jgi:hypothetical protein
LFKIIASFFNICWLLYTCDIVRSGYEMRVSDGLGYWQ